MFVDVIHAFTILAINTFAIVYIGAGREGSGVSASWLVPIFLTRDFITVCDAEFEACITFEFKFGADWIGRGHLSFCVLHFAIGKRNGQTGYILA